MLGGQDLMLRAQSVFKVFWVIMLFSIAGLGQEVPVLENGESPQRVLHEKHLRRTNGFSIFRFLVKADGGVDSIKISSSYFEIVKQDSIIRAKDKIDFEIIKNFKFQSSNQDIWVQCKVYSEYFTNKSDTVYYGFKDLYKNEIDTYFKDENGNVLEYIIQRGVVIFAPTYIYGVI